MNANQYLAMQSADKTTNEKLGWFSAEFYILSDAIDKLTHPERIILRQELESIGHTKIIRTLYYDYTQQRWI